MKLDGPDDREPVQRLLAEIRASLPKLEALLEETCSHWGYEDPVYRFYHQSLKVYSLQATTEKIVHALERLAPDLALNDWFSQIVREGTGKTFSIEDNRTWLPTTRPIIEA